LFNNYILSHTIAHRRLRTQTLRHDTASQNPKKRPLTISFLKNPGGRVPRDFIFKKIPRGSSASRFHLKKKTPGSSASKLHFKRGRTSLCVAVPQGRRVCALPRRGCPVHTTRYLFLFLLLFCLFLLLLYVYFLCLIFIYFCIYFYFCFVFTFDFVCCRSPRPESLCVATS